MSILPFELVLIHLNQFNFKSTNTNETFTIVESFKGISIQSKEDIESLHEVLNKLETVLEIPESCSYIDDEELTSIQLLERERYLNQSPSLLSLALSLIQLLPQSNSRPTTEELSLATRLLLFYGRFTDTFHSEGFVSARSVEISNQITSHILTTSTRLPLIRHILSESFPPLFKPHPKLNPETGRILSRPRGGERGILDWYEESEVRESWRKEIGMSNVLKVVLKSLEKNEVEDVWPLILPPLLAYLDDYEASNKVLGTSILSALLEKVDHSLLRRTGVGLIFEQSLTSCFTTLTSPLTPLLLSSTHEVSLILLPLIYPVSDSEDQFNAYCTLLSNSIIQTWEFKAAKNLSIELVNLQNLKTILPNLGKAGTIRFLSILIPKLSLLIVGTGLASGENGKDQSSKMLIQTNSSENLILILRLVGKVRIDRWKGVILGSIGKAWQSLEEELVNKKEIDKVQRTKLESSLKELIKVLCEVFGEEMKDDLKKFKELDPMFERLIQQDEVIV